MLFVDDGTTVSQASVCRRQLKGSLSSANEEHICIVVENAMASLISIPASLDFHLVVVTKNML